MCPVGHFSGIGAAACQACESGKYTALIGTKSCEDCPTHQDTVNIGNTKCTCKDSFTTTTNAATGAISCKCGPGYTLESGRCVLCAPGFYKGSVGNEACRKCNTDEHKEGVLDSVSTNTPATSSLDCTCSKSDFRVLEPPKANTTHYVGQCLPCPDGTDCSAPGITVEALPLLAGYWRSNSSSYNVVQCYAEVACTHPNRTTTAADFNVDDQCTEGHTGPVCNVCKEGHAKSVTGECDVCVNETKVPEEMCVCERPPPTPPPSYLSFALAQVRVRGNSGRNFGGGLGVRSSPRQEEAGEANKEAGVGR